MSAYSESEAVAKDFRDALEDLQSNARYEISNLTVIARENTEHALAISGALQDHIKRVAPHKKLPALYLLDSIVKNVGTPYTLFFGRKLYQTFMDAYASVDPVTRRKMDEMLKTWKESIPGSIDTRPVFPPEVVRPIENALIKARTNALQAQQEHMRSQQQLLGRNRPLNQGMPYRETPTPPGAHSSAHAQLNGYHQASMPATTNGTPYANAAHSTPAGYPLSQHQQPLPPSRSTPQPSQASMAFQPPPSLPSQTPQLSRSGGYVAPQTGISIDALNGDIQKLITASKAQYTLTPHDPSVQTRLRALMDLQTILQTQNLPQHQLVLIENQIADLAVTIRAPPAQTHTTTIHTPVPAPVVVAPPPAATPKVTIDSLFGTGALAALMARGSAPPQVPSPATVAIRSPPPQRAQPQKPVNTQPSQPPPSDPMALMNMLRQAGLLPAATPTGNSTATLKPLPLPFPIPMPGATTTNQSIRLPTLETLASDITLKSSSLKQFRPHLLPQLFGSLGPQCTQCGRRFQTDEKGKKKKTAHMDWHFRVNQRIADAEKRGHHRSWLVDEVDWIKSREVLDKDYVPSSGDPDAVSGGSSSKAPKLQYIPVPDDPRSTSAVCPICQEKFSTMWLDEAQEFVWQDAFKVGERVYHVSCHKEATKDGGNTPVYVRSTPEPILGKRKAEDELTSTRGKPKAEGA